MQQRVTKSQQVHKDCILIILYRCRYCVDLRKLTCNNTNLDLVNAYAKCGEIPFICPQNIEREQNSDSSQELYFCC